MKLPASAIGDYPQRHQRTGALGLRPTTHNSGAMLVTADERHYNKARLEGHIILLAGIKPPD